MPQYTQAARRLALSALRPRALPAPAARPTQMRSIATQPPKLKPDTMSRGTFLTSVAVIGGLSGAGVAYVTTPVQ